MDLLSKVTLAVAVTILAVFIAYYAISHASLSQQVTEAQATSLVMHDLQNSYPDAVVNITNVTPSQYTGSWHILVSIVLNATSPCPSYYIYSFDYPKYGFVSRIDNTYTSNCNVYGTGSGYAIGSYPVAITESYLLRNNLTALDGFINKYGFSNVVVRARYYNSTVFHGKRYAQVWVVNYTAVSSTQYIDVLLSQLNGTAVSIYAS